MLQAACTSGINGFLLYEQVYKNNEAQTGQNLIMISELAQAEAQ